VPLAHLRSATIDDVGGILAIIGGAPDARVFSGGWAQRTNLFACRRLL